MTAVADPRSCPIVLASIAPQQYHNTSECELPKVCTRYLVGNKDGAASRRRGLGSSRRADALTTIRRSGKTSSQERDARGLQKSLRAMVVGVDRHCRCYCRTQAVRTLLQQYVCGRAMILGGTWTGLVRWSMDATLCREHDVQDVPGAR